MTHQRHILVGGDGWLKARREPSGTTVALPEFLRVEFEGSADGRDFFTVREGMERGNRFSVKSGSLRAGSPAYRGPAGLQFSMSRRALAFSGGQVRAVTRESEPIAFGVHPLYIPDFPHLDGATYLAQSVYAKTWFCLGFARSVAVGGDCYLQPGAISAGCITVEPADWTRVWRYLILCRSRDERTVGTITVVA